MCVNNDSSGDSCGFRRRWMSPERLQLGRQSRLVCFLLPAALHKAPLCLDVISQSCKCDWRNDYDGSHLSFLQHYFNVSYDIYFRQAAFFRRGPASLQSRGSWQFWRTVDDQLVWDWAAWWRVPFSTLWKNKRQFRHRDWQNNFHVQKCQSCVLE